ncbi:hypothetical protein [Alkalihalobacillus sp. AL-G]|uniref:hypothetical protein n=1 Tax=Alkalihalobacillus sp. AL-G TaxID=2926399 RepID=UPI00272B01B1|nr:hypothetical protein [Alkalihalobacillus sp. AL-G]WLD92633.1 hypothetical protein MOJ78_16685 [Alkalihalobacillus sp. AL-G]
MMDISEVALIPLITGLTEWMKQMGLPKKYSSLVAVIFGLSISIIYVYPQQLKTGILFGLMLGLSASGFYSSSKVLLRKNKTS